jgi:uncharacterized protein (DUF608 family)
MPSRKASTNVITEMGTFTSGLALGGMGTGGVELWPDGRFHFWNIANSRPWAQHQPPGPDGLPHSIPPLEPNLGDTDFILRIARPGQRPIYRWLFAGNGLLTTTASHFFRHHKYYFIKSMPRIDYRGTFPFIELDYVDESLPVDVHLTAWSPFICRDVKNSSLPGFYLDFSVTSKVREPLDISLIWQQENFAGYAADSNEQAHEKTQIRGALAVHMRGSLAQPDHDSSGCMTIWARPGEAQTATAIASNPYMQNIIWSIHRSGGLEGPIYPSRISREELANPPRPGAPNKGWLCVQSPLEPGASTRLQMGMGWHFPNHRTVHRTRIGHVYENWFADSTQVVDYLIENRDDLHARSRRMTDLLMQSKLPETLKLALLDQMSTLIKSTHFSKDGRFGLQEGHGCCAFNTVDVDHYSSYALSILQPDIRKQVNDQQTALAHPDLGKIHHGLPGSIEESEAGSEDRPYRRWDCCCQYVLQVYRDCKWSGDLDSLRRYWKTVKRAMEVIIDLDFYQIHLPYIEGGITYDHWRMKGVVGYMAGVYLAALAAMKDIADLLDDAKTQARAAELLEKGIDAFEQYLHDGQQYLLYYARRPKDWSPEDEQRGEEGYLEAPRPDACCTREGAYVEIEDTGLMTDLLNGHATAKLLGLGGLHDPKRVARQLRLILERNVQPENDAIVNGTYPDGHFLDEWPFMQWQTPWTGSEYFLAIQLYEAGMTAQGDEVIDLVHRRHVREGMRFDHAECNNHYARPLCIWGAYASRLGLDVDAIRARLSILPKFKGSYQGLLLTATATGRLSLSREKDRTEATIEILDGRQPIKQLTLPCGFEPGRAALKIDGKTVKAQLDRAKASATLVLSRKQDLIPGKTLEVTLS